METARTWVPRALGTIVFLWYALAAAPGFYWLDSAELSAGALGLGTPHATGFPLYMLLAKLASFFPIGELAFRINLLSAACAGFAVGGTSLLVLRLGKEDWPTIVGAASGGGVLALSLLFARQATVAEVYAPTAALIVLTLLLFEKVVQGAPASVGLSLAWVAGLGLGLHPSYRMLMGLPILALFALRLFRGARWPLLAPMVTSLSALALYLYFPVRSATGRIASLDWGHADTLQRTWSHANASNVRKAFDEEMMSGQSAVLSENVKTFAAQIGEHVGLLSVLAAVVGLALLFRERKTRWMAGTLALIATLDAIYAAWINPMGLVDLQNGVPLTMVICLCAGLAVAALARLTGPAAPFVGVVVGLVLLIPSALVTLPTLAGVGDLPRAVSEESLLQGVPGSVVLTQSDSMAAGTLYLANVEGARPDMAFLVLPMLADTERVAAELNRSGGVPVAAPAASTEALATIARTRRPMYWESGSIGVPGGMYLQEGALVSRVVPGQPSADTLRQSVARLQTIFGQAGRQERIARRTLAGALTNMGRAAFGRQDADLSRDIFKAALEVRPEHAAARVNLGVLESRNGNLEAAATITERALQDEPNRHRALVNAARYRLALGELEVAAGHAERALRVAPLKSSSWTMAALVDMKREQVPRARTRLKRALELSPNNREPQAALRSL